MTLAPAGSTWAGSHHYAARGLARPRSVEELQELVTAEPRLRALGSRHSFTDLADTDGVLVGLDAMPRTVELDTDARTVRVAAGMRYGDVAVDLHGQGWALGNLASLPHISVGGAVATGTHGSGIRNGSLATAVAAIEFVDGRGELVRLARGDEAFEGAVVALGLLGVVTHLELDVEPAYDIRQTLYEGMTWDALLGDLDGVLGAAYSVSAFTRWREVEQVWVKSRDAVADELFGAHRAPAQRHMIAGMPTENTTAQLGVPGPWHERLPHFRLGFMPSGGEELQTEYFVARERGAEAIEAVRGLADRIEPLLLVSELRTIAADDLWLSGAEGRDTLALHFTWVRDLERVPALLPALEERLLPLGARAHWGKLFAAGPDVWRPRYRRWADFAALRRRFDPERRFANAWAERVLG